MRFDLRRDETYQDSEADTRIIGRTLASRYAAVDPSYRTKPPTYLFSNQRFQRAEKRYRPVRLVIGDTRLTASAFPSRAPARRSVARPVGTSAPPVSGYLRRAVGPCKHFFGARQLFRSAGRSLRRLAALRSGSAPTLARSASTSYEPWTTPIAGAVADACPSANVARGFTGLRSVT